MMGEMMMADENTRIDVKKQDGINMMPNASATPNASTTFNASTMPGTGKTTGTDKLIGVPPEKLHEIANHVRSVADGLACTLMAASTLADSLQALINDMPAKAGHGQGNTAYGAGAVQETSANEQSAPSMGSSTSVTSTQDCTAQPPEPISLVDLRAYVAARSTPDKRPKIREALLKYGVKRLTDLQPAQYAAFKAEVDAL